MRCPMKFGRHNTTYINYDCEQSECAWWIDRSNHSPHSCCVLIKIAIELERPVIHGPR